MLYNWTRIDFTTGQSGYKESGVKNKVWCNVQSKMVNVECRSKGNVAIQQLSIVDS